KNFDDSNWENVRVPHDYAVNGGFSQENDKQIISVFQDDIHKAITHIGRTGGLPIDEEGWYRKNFSVSENAKKIFLEFDGVMSKSTIYINGKICHKQIYGYTSFSVDITDFCEKGENLLAVNLKPSGTSSRWYSGAGIYREVRIVEKNESFFPYNAGFIIPEIKGNVAYVECNLDVINFSENCYINYKITDKFGKIVAQNTNNSNSPQLFKLNGFAKWNVLDSYLYTLEAKLCKDDKVLDTYKTKFGFRSLKFDAQKGFFINDKSVKLNGVCLHHDLGALGAAFNKSAAQRQIEKLIDIGVNSIRTSHNPPDPQFLDLCDEYGILVIDEAFDEWKSLKVTNGYGHYFEECAKADLTAMIRRDRNHPCVIMWSIGNEVFEETMRNGWAYSKYLSDICKQEDRTRAVTAGVPRPWEAFKNGFCDFLDVVGINYRPQMYEKLHNEYPNVPLYASETCSCVSSRGEYYLSHNLENIFIPRDNLQINSNDLESCTNGYYPEREFFFQDKHDFICGEYVWTGFDYIGEPSPYREEWPSRSSYFGIFDLCGLAKDRAYSYKTKWTDKEVMHLFPHWNWNEGDVIDMHCYSNYDEVELFVNGKSVGISVKNKENDVLRHRHIWRDVKFVKGEVTAVSVRNPLVYHTIKTAGKANKIILKPEKKVIKADGEELVYVECIAVDKDENFVPKADFRLDFAVKGAEYLASDAGDATSTRVFNEKFCNLYNGKCVVIIRSEKDKKGQIELLVKSEKTKEVKCFIEVK
ncbi:MAG: glycoside hydrolase family 2 TIM barrel-domain containing protein, partial [Clostridia bacterium]